MFPTSFQVPIWEIYYGKRKWPIGMPKDGQDNRIEPTASNSEVGMPHATLLRLAKILARQAAQTCFREGTAEDCPDRARHDTAPRKAPDVE